MPQAFCIGSERLNLNIHVWDLSVNRVYEVIGGHLELTFVGNDGSAGFGRPWALGCVLFRLWGLILSLELSNFPRFEG